MSTTKRRNGQLPSCEPCRKAKLRCDHEMPVCGRCAQRGQQSSCIYHPAPMTQPRSAVKKAESIKKRKREPSILTERKLKPSINFLQQYRTPAVHHTQGYHHHHQQQQQQHAPPGHISNDAVPSEAIQGETLKPRKSNFSTGFLGPSSFWAAFDETAESNSSQHGACDTPNATDPCATVSSGYSHSPSGTEVMPESNLTSADADQIECGARILLLLEDLELYQKFMQYRFEILKPWVFNRSLVFDTMDGLFALREEFRQSSTKISQAKLLAWSERLFENSAKPITTHAAMTRTEYFTSIAARWETIGLMFTWVGVSALIIPDDHELLRLGDGSVVDVDKLRKITVELTEICLGFCDTIGTLSDPLIWLLLQQTILLGETYGDSDYRTWRKLGDLSTIIFASGLHRPKSNSSVPLFLLETRKRAMAAALSVDKTLATLLGRPPHIAYQYCDVQAPLDLSYDTICEISEGKDDIARHLGPDGWNVHNTITTGTRAKVHVMLAMIREKALALSLSPHCENLEQKVLAICAEHEQMRESLPAKLKWEQSSYGNLDDHDRGLLEALHLDLLHNEFILYSVLIRRTGERKDKLIQAARKILNTLLSFITSRSPSVFIAYRSTWELCYIGLPCAGVLAQELLQRSQRKHRQHTSSNNLSTNCATSSNNGSNPAVFPRSEIIQNLSVFASLLETALRGRDGNNNVARRGLAAIRNILDRVLSADEYEENHPPSSLPPPYPGHSHQSLEQQQQQEQEQQSKQSLDQTTLGYTSHQIDSSSISPSHLLSKEVSPIASRLQAQPQPQPQAPQQQSGSIIADEVNRIPAITNSTFTAFSSGSGELGPSSGLTSHVGVDAQFHAPDDNFLAVDFMTWLDNFDWAQESLLNYS